MQIGLAHIGAPAVVVELAGQAADEEARHVELCVELVRGLGVDIETPPVREHAWVPTNTVRRDVLLEVVGMCCINETISAVVLREMLAAASPGPVEQTVRAILRDEIGHSRIGWALLAHTARTDSVDEVSAALPHLLSCAVTDELFDTPPQLDPDDTCRADGTVPRAVRLALFREALLDVVFPGLERFGVSTAAGHAWLEARG